MDVTWLESPAPKSKQFGMLAASDVVISEGRAFTEILCAWCIQSGGVIIQVILFMLF